ncbi:hypothetical protein SAMN04487960_10521 [Marinobacter mobilis]|uniref:Uncharacterized protein n=1 Tax=Marinobacter mobilis TaxID=488533 RepID=A0A1H2XEQ5_9GAMM|nr:hypothetical protein SAMN04487960_10521 [Marinobacter mobilis]
MACMIRDTGVVTPIRYSVEKASVPEAYLLFSANSRFRINILAAKIQSVVVKYKKEAGLHGKHC